ncbi:hypothetical protein [Cupriavidus sp. D39]|uniref:hypothetical protein n=1 Tax=Cupriavidus sp. D39 TaxID=2997877 RepID=UPI00226FDB84|nr:hypothetical protein [Cupriavidus sp. D39]MCY0858768.1 hypothetical protein [Cupriavidus sp. D39]
MPDFFLQNNIDNLSKSATTLSKLGIFAGGVCITFYSLEIGYFPQELSVGDGVLF